MCWGFGGAFLGPRRRKIPSATPVDKTRERRGRKNKTKKLEEKERGGRGTEKLGEKKREEEELRNWKRRRGGTSRKIM